MNGAIDSVSLHLTNFEVLDASAIEIRHGRENYKTKEIIGEIPLFKDSKGNWVMGESAFYNNPLWQFDRNKFGAFVKLSIPLVHNNGSNNILPPKSKKEVTAVFERVESEMLNKGIKASLLDNNLSRVDIFKMIESNYEYGNYGAVYKALNVSRKSKREFGNDSHYWKNAQSEFVIYDKYKEVFAKHGNTFSLPQNSHRHETRFMKGRKVREVLKVATAKELIWIYDSLPVITANELSKIFHTPPNEFKLGLNEDFRNNLILYLEAGRNGKQRILNDAGRKFYIDILGIDNFLKIIGEVCGRSQKNKERKEVSRIELEYGLNNNDLIDLYDEIRTKAINPYYEFRLCA